MRKPAQVVLIVLLVIAIGVVGLIAYLRASIHHIGFLTTSDVKVLMSAANEARVAVTQNKACLFTIDESSIGNKEHETEMLYVAAMLDLYRAKFGVAAHSMEDLDRLHAFDQTSELDTRHLQKDCYVYVDPNSAFVVTCGGSKPSDPELAKFMRSAAYVQRFYRLGESEILYIPAPKC